MHDINATHAPTPTPNNLLITRRVVLSVDTYRVNQKAREPSEDPVYIYTDNTTLRVIRSLWGLGVGALVAFMSCIRCFLW